MRTASLIVLLAVTLLGTTCATPLMVYTGKLTPITPRIPPPPVPIPYPPIPPAPVNEEPEEPINSLLYHQTFKYGFRIKPLRTYVNTYQIPIQNYNKGYVYSFN